MQEEYDIQVSANDLYKRSNALLLIVVEGL
jgi:hypothetical protein